MQVWFESVSEHLHSNLFESLPLSREFDDNDRRSQDGLPMAGRASW